MTQQEIFSHCVTPGSDIHPFFHAPSSQTYICTSPPSKQFLKCFQNRRSSVCNEKHPSFVLGVRQLSPHQDLSEGSVEAKSVGRV